MAVISGKEKEKLIELFEERGVNFYHACQWVDFKTYCSLGGLPSRGLMENGVHNFTKFDTDGRDKDNSVWNHVFGNLIDSGWPFSRGGANNEFVATPNVFGPILLVFKPSVFNTVEDVAIALRSAGGESFSRDDESLSTVDDVNKIFQFEDIGQVEYDQQKSYIKFRNELKNVFPKRECGNPEVSCSVQGELISFENLFEVIVDDLTVRDNSLIDHVKKALNDMGITCPVTLRNYKDGRKQLLADLVDELIMLHEKNKDESTEEVSSKEGISTNLDKWIERVVADESRKFQFMRFLKYFEKGTIIELLNEQKIVFNIFNLPPF